MPPSISVLSIGPLSTVATWISRCASFSVERDGAARGMRRRGMLSGQVEEFPGSEKAT